MLVVHSTSAYDREDRDLCICPQLPAKIGHKPHRSDESVYFVYAFRVFFTNLADLLEGDLYCESSGRCYTSVRHHLCQCCEMMST